MSEALAAHKEQINHVAVCGGWLGIREADSTLNDYNRKIIVAIKEQCGVAYLGDVNYRDHDKGDIDIVFREYAGEKLYNFCASFVVPCKDKILEDLILDWRKNNSIKSLDRLTSRIEQIGGFNLFWS